MSSSRSSTASSVASQTSSCRTQTNFHPHFCLIDVYPSIARPIHKLRQLEGSADVSTLLILSEKFTSSLSTFVTSMPNRLPRDKHPESDYVIAHSAVLFVMKQFAASVARIDPVFEAEGLAASLEQLDLVISTLGNLLATARVCKVLPPAPPLDIHRNGAMRIKPPASPQPSTSTLSRSSTLCVPPSQRCSRKSLVEMVEEAKFAAESPKVETPPPIPEDDTSSLETKADSVEVRISHATIEETSIPANHSVKNVKLLSPTTPSDESKSISETRTIASTVQTISKNSKVIRRFLQLSFNLPFTRSKEKLAQSPGVSEQPIVQHNPSPPGGPGLAPVKLEDAKLGARSIPEIMDLVTGKEIISKPELKELFFTTFRWFLPAKVFVQELSERYRAPSNLSPTQAKIWGEWQQKHDNTQLRIMNLVLMWIQQYWIPELDNKEALPILQEFALSHLVTYPDENLVYRIIKALDDAEKRTVSRQMTLREHWDLLNSGTLVAPPESSGFNLVISPGRNHLCKLLQFDSPEGKVEFTRQLTVYFSELYARLDADCFVWGHYHGVENEAIKLSNVISCQEEGLREWVIASIQSISDPVERENMIHFWFAIAQNCADIGSSSPVLRIMHALTKMNETFQWFNHQRYAGLKELLNWGRSGYMKQSRMRRAQNLPCIQTLFSVKEGIERLKDMISVVPEHASYDRYSLLAKCIADIDHAKLSYKFTKLPAVQEWIGTQLTQYIPDPKP
ncbi:cell division cycle-related protein [Stygiomarasmius scandens]|uniref:Cell division cycle-related protein n=1 Tax=Marasmiellus scandens TaxID=2682957 RepID=A0ABR1JY98_9AGAR